MPGSVATALVNGLLAHHSAPVSKTHSLTNFSTRSTSFDVSEKVAPSPSFNTGGQPGDRAGVDFRPAKENKPIEVDADVNDVPRRTDKSPMMEGVPWCCNEHGWYGVNEKCEDTCDYDPRNPAIWKDLARAVEERQSEPKWKPKWTPKYYGPANNPAIWQDLARDVRDNPAIMKALALDVEEKANKYFGPGKTSAIWKDLARDIRDNPAMKKDLARDVEEGSKWNPKNFVPENYLRGKCVRYEGYFD